LLRSRIDTTKRQLLDTSASPADLAFAAGFESLSAFHENFLRLNGLTPSAYRALASGHTFSLSLPNDYPLPFLRRALSRDIHSVTEKLQGDTYTAAVFLNGEPTLLRLQLSPAAIEVEVLGARAARPSIRSVADRPSALPIGAAAHSIVIGLLGLEQDAAAFARLAHKLGLARLVAGRRGLRLSQVPAVFDGLLWSIIGQQINFPFACLLRRRLIERTGTPLDNGLIAPPLPTAVATLEPADLRALQFSRQKADYVIAAACLVAEGKLDLAALRTMSATRAERTMLAIHGLGPWSVNYLMMRALGFADCVPLGDTGVTSGLQSLFKLDPRPDIDATRRLMTVFSPYRSLATAHLWQFNQPSPT
jgi:AraC family transcriptional regulator of adaptative response / DNA-3-methyladenine glycosylase II